MRMTAKTRAPDARRTKSRCGLVVFADDERKVAKVSRKPPARIDLCVLKPESAQSGGRPTASNGTVIS
ncbi:hypothetical protein NBRC116596_28110 [Litorivita sp. NS0012-18]